jgi:hypothetical protein
MPSKISPNILAQPADMQSVRDKNKPIPETTAANTDPNKLTFILTFLKMKYRASTGEQQA